MKDNNKMSVSMVSVQRRKGKYITGAVAGPEIQCV